MGWVCVLSCKIDGKIWVDMSKICRGFHIKWIGFPKSSFYFFFFSLFSFLSPATTLFLFFFSPPPPFWEKSFSSGNFFFFWAAVTAGVPLSTPQIYGAGNFPATVSGVPFRERRISDFSRYGEVYICVCAWFYLLYRPGQKVSA